MLKLIETGIVVVVNQLKDNLKHVGRVVVKDLEQIIYKFNQHMNI